MYFIRKSLFPWNVQCTHLWYLQVLEARNIAAPNDLLRAFKSINAFVILSVSTEAGLTSQQTHIQRNTLEPRWNEQLTFKDISAADSIRLALMDRKRLTSDNQLGQVWHS